MTQHGNEVPSIESQRVRDQLSEESDGKAIKRLTAARECLAGFSPARIEATYGWHEQTVYGWLNRFEERDFEDALYDDKPPGRSPELGDHRFDQFAAALHESPGQAGYDEPAWSSTPARQYLLERFDVAHSQRHVSRPMNEAEMAYRKPRPQPASADERERKAFHETVEGRIGERDDNAVVVTIDQPRKTIGADLTYAWFPIDERPTIDVSASRDGIDLLGVQRRCRKRFAPKSPLPIMEPRITVITLGVGDLEESLTFYRDGLGWPTEGIVGAEFEGGDVAFFPLNRGLQLALYPKDRIAEDANVDGTATSSAEFTLGHNVESKGEVDEVMETAEKAGAEITDSPRDRVWGGYSGHFKDPDDHLWEVVWNPEFEIEE